MNVENAFAKVIADLAQFKQTTLITSVVLTMATIAVVIAFAVSGPPAHSIAGAGYGTRTDVERAAVQSHAYKRITVYTTALTVGVFATAALWGVWALSLELVPFTKQVIDAAEATISVVRREGEKMLADALSERAGDLTNAITSSGRGLLDTVSDVVSAVSS